MEFSTDQIKLCAIQLTSTPNVEHNLQVIEQQLHQLCIENSDDTVQLLVVLPECCLFFGGQDKAQLNLAEQTYQTQYLSNSLAALAKKFQCFLVGGSIPLWIPEKKKFSNTCQMFSPKGTLLTQYNKIHLFDVDVDDSEKCYRESKYTQAGSSLSLAELPFANVGLSICYDLRFPELFRQLTNLGAQIICVPAAFTQVTGRAHWLPLLQARAIENQVYIVAAGQQGIHQNGRETWGHSVIIDPWGEVNAMLETGIGHISVPFDFSRISDVRTNIPVAKHNQFSVRLNTTS